MKNAVSISSIITRVDLGLVPYEALDAILEEYMLKTRRQMHNYLIFAKHPPVYTIGSDENRYDVEAIRVDRGGSITYFDEGCMMVYFSFLVPSPPRFYKGVLRAFQRVFELYDQSIAYDFGRPGFYVGEEKIASLGFRYKNGVSKHGVSIHLDPDLTRFNQIKPCGLEGVRATSFKERGIPYDEELLKEQITRMVHEQFR